MRSDRASRSRGRAFGTVALGWLGAARAAPMSSATSRGLPFELAVGEAERAIAVAEVHGVAAPVALERLARAVVPPAVGFDDEPLLGEEEVDLLAAEGVVDLRRRQAVLVADRDEEAFDVASLERGAGRVVRQRARQPPRFSDARGGLLPSHRARGSR